MQVLARSWIISCKPMLLVCSVLALLVFKGTLPVWAHSFDVTETFSDFEAKSCTHEDGPDQQGVWAGWMNLTVTNEGDEPWGDFHFEIIQVGSYGPIDNVDWDDTTNTPTSSQTLVRWTVDNLAVGATLDLFFYGDPVLPGETATFSVCNVNPDQVAFFGTAFYPTPVPVPGAIWLLSAGLIGVVSIKKRLHR